MAEEADIDAYFERIGFAGSIAPSFETLSQLHQLHPAAIPFENLDTLMGVPVRLDLRNLQQKLLFDRRGGYCLEHNLLFKAVLQSLDYEVKLIGARSLWGHTEGEERPIGHVVLLVEVAGASYLVDVGFSAVTLTAPLRLRAEVEQETPLGTFRLAGGDPVWRLETRLGEDWAVLYSFERGEIGDAEVGEINERASTGTLRDTLVAARAEKTRRHALRNLRLRTYPLEGEKETRTLTSLAELREVLAGTFGIALPAGERLDPALERIIASEAAR